MSNPVKHDSGSNSIVPSGVPKGLTDDSAGIEQAQLYSQNSIDQKLKEIQELKKLNQQPEERKPNENPLKPDDSKQAIMMLALCALFAIGAVATGGVLAQVLAVCAGATGLFGLKKAKDAIFPPGAPIEKKVKSAHEKALDAKLKELEHQIEYQRGYERGKDGGARDPDSNERDARKSGLSYFKTAIPKPSQQELVGYDKGVQDKKQSEQQLKKDQSGQQDSSLESRIKGLEDQLSSISSQLAKRSAASPPVAELVRQKSVPMQDPGHRGDGGADPTLSRRPALRSGPPVNTGQVDSGGRGGRVR